MLHHINRDIHACQMAIEKLAAETELCRKAGDSWGIVQTGQLRLKLIRELRVARKAQREGKLVIQ